MRSSGIYAQSIGGGGGSGAGAGGLVAVAGNASEGGAGGSVSVTNRSAITTSGTESRGIFAQSIGGGGGNGAGAGGLVGVAGSGSTASDGGAVTVDSIGDITTGYDVTEMTTQQRRDRCVTAT